MAMKDWLKILKLGRLPSFSDIHELADSDFELLYFRDDPELAGFTDNLLENLQGDFPSGATRVQAPPGWGKTSFFFYLARFLNKKDNPTFVHIFNATELASRAGIDNDSIIRECLNALIEYSTACCSDTTRTEYIINNQDLPDNVKVRQLVSFIKTNQGLFSKRLVAILDGVDLLPQDQVLETAMALFHHLQSTHIIKWLAIRDTTYGSYSPLARDQVATMFPSLYCLPNLSLYEIALLRIKHAGDEKSTMPFSKKLCHQIQRLAAGDHRQGLATLFELVQSNKPRGLRGRSPDKIRAFFERNATEVFLRRELLPNLFRPDINPDPLLPLVKEVMTLIYYRKRIDDTFRSLLKESFEKKLVALGVGGRINVKIIKKDVNDAVMMLSRIGLISCRNLDNITVTEKGLAVREYIEHQHYIRECRKLLLNIVTDDLFWDLALVQSDFRVMLMRMYFATDIDPN